MSEWELQNQPHPCVATEGTDKGIERLCEYGLAAVRENIGYDMSLSIDHLGHIDMKSVIRLGRAYEKFNLEWIEDVIPWFHTDLLREITQESPTPTLIGEDIYRIEDFETLSRDMPSTRFIPNSRPPAAFCGRIASATWHCAMEFLWRCTSPGLPSAAWPVSIALRHRANFLALNHSLDVPWWSIS